MNEQQISDRGIEAARVLENPAFKDGIEALKAATLASLKKVGSRDDQGRLIATMYLKLADTLEEVLGGFIEAGKFADHNLQRAMDSVRDEHPARKIMRRIL